MKDPYQIIQTILVTEKGTELADEHNQYSFKVSKGANKF
ncbi:MAG: 50S ribosomal protein L23, partial [Lentisphaeria bacterium]|nr:50S ribosomal protein L23 [Lentisphaeria bacterium]